MHYFVKGGKNYAHLVPGPDRHRPDRPTADGPDRTGRADDQPTKNEWNEPTGTTLMQSVRVRPSGERVRLARARAAQSTDFRSFCLARSSIPSVPSVRLARPYNDCIAYFFSYLFGPFIFSFAHSFVRFVRLFVDDFVRSSSDSRLRATKKVNGRLVLHRTMGSVVNDTHVLYSSVGSFVRSFVRCVHASVGVGGASQSVLCL